MSPPATLHLMVGLPGTGKTTRARELERDTGALRLTPDEWLVPLLGHRWQDLADRRDVLEGRLIWVAHQVLRLGGPVVLDLGCWSAQERWALRAIAQLAGARFQLHHLSLERQERIRRATTRWREAPGQGFELSAADHERFEALFSAPSAAELRGDPLPPPPEPFDSWPAWAADRWPSLPRLYP